MDLVKINRNGQVSIPANLRKKLSLKTGEFLRVEEDPSGTGKIVLTPVTVAGKEPSKEELLKRFEEEGVNLGAILSNLEKTPTERIRELEHRLELIEKWKKGELKG